MKAPTPEHAPTLAQGLRGPDRDPSIRVVVITGTGRAFSAGQDLKDLDSIKSPDGKMELGGLLRDHYNPLIRRIRALEKPVIAAVNGVAAGAGMSLALACDLRIAAGSATFVTAFSAIGLIPDSGMYYFLPRMVGWPKAMELMLSSERLAAEDALRLGLLNRVVPAEELESAVGELAGKLAKGPAVSYALIKRGLERARMADLDTVLEMEAQYQAAAGRTEDFREGVEAFVAKRPPTFRGR
jgi:2-(1,2-epoxy-1,2-dihydrophenyl)acetyl-CoA isomerase